MPSVAISDFIYAALFYKDGEFPENPESKDFVQGEVADSEKLIFSFQRPDDTSDITFTLEIFAFIKTEGETNEETSQFSRENALLSGYKDGLAIDDDSDEIKVTDPIALSSSEPGTVSLKIKVPAGCSLEIDDTTHFTVTGTSPNFTLTQVGDGISAGAYKVNFTVKKGDEIVHIFSEYINVIKGLCTDTWSGSGKGVAKEITNSISKAVYVRGAGGWYETSLYNETVTASDSNLGSLLSPLATIQKAVDTVIARNDGANAYTIYVDGTLKYDDSTYIGANGMADFTALKQELNLTIKALSGTAMLDGGARLNEDGTVVEEGSKNRIIYAAPASDGTLNLTLENLTITGGNAINGKGGGIYVNSGAFIMERCTVSGNIANAEGGAIYIAKSAEAKMTDDEIKGNKAARCGGVYVYGGRLEMKNCKVEGNISTSYYMGGIGVTMGGTVIMDGGTISRNEVRGIGGFDKYNQGGGVYVSYSTSTFTMKGDATISGNILSEKATSRYGSEVYVDDGMFEMEDGTVSGGNATSGGGVYVSGGTFTMEGGTISDCTSSNRGNGLCLNYGCTFNMSGSAKFIGDNDVYLYASGSIIPTICITGELTASSPIATITPTSASSAYLYDYTENRPLLSAGDGVTLDGSICDKFAVKPQSDGTEWRCALDGADGVLIRKYALGDTGPGGGAVCYYSADGFIVNGKTCHYLECSKDPVGTTSWCPCTSSGGYCELTLSTGVGAGYANTQAILAHPNHASVTASNCAAKACAEYSTSTTTAGEWFLPSHNEATKINRGIVITNDENLWVSGNPLISSESDNSKAGSLYVESNGFSGGSKAKNIYLSVRAMRAF